MTSSYIFYTYSAHRDLHSFPTRRSSDLHVHRQHVDEQQRKPEVRDGLQDRGGGDERVQPRAALPARDGDRKSTRLNSSHVAISYAVFCLKKKKTKAITQKNRHKEADDRT